MLDMARRPDPSERVLGPYPHHRGWRLIFVRGDGRRIPYPCESRADAERLKLVLERKISSIIHTTDTAREAFVKDMTARKLSPRTIEGYEWAINTMWPLAKPLRSLTPEHCAERYKELRTEKVDDRQRFSVDAHRNALKWCKTFLRWCVSEKLIKDSPMEKVIGEGRRKKGKPQLRRDEGRLFYAHALARADAGEPGAVAALMCLLLTLRAESEALAVVARDIDDGARLLWVDDSKTPSGRRVEEVPEEMRPALLALRGDKKGEEHLFARRDRKWLWDEVARLCAEAGVPRVSPHGLRGMHATLAKMAGATSHMVAGSLGHSGPRVTEDHYIAAGPAQAAERERGLTLIRGGR
jgi:integrase